MQIYEVFYENYTDEYYVNLSNDEILTIPVLIEIMGNGSYNQRIKACGIIEKIIKNNPERLYPFAEYLFKAVKKYDDFPQWCILKVISNIIDGTTDYAECLLELLVEALTSDNIGKFSIACDCVLILSENYPSVKELFTAATADVAERNFKIGKEVSESCRNVALQKIETVNVELSL